MSVCAIYISKAKSCVLHFNRDAWGWFSQHPGQCYSWIYIYICNVHMAVDRYSCFRKRHLREKKIFRESFATPSPRPFVCSVRSGAIVAAAVVLANTVAAVHLRAVRSVSHRHSPLPLAVAGDVRSLATSSLAFRRSFAERFKPRRMVTEYIIPCKDL